MGGQVVALGACGYLLLLACVALVQSQKTRTALSEGGQPLVGGRQHARRPFDSRVVPGAQGTEDGVAAVAEHDMDGPHLLARPPGALAPARGAPPRWPPTVSSATCQRAWLGSGASCDNHPPGVRIRGAAPGAHGARCLFLSCLCRLLSRTAKLSCQLFQQSKFFVKNILRLGGQGRIRCRV